MSDATEMRMTISRGQLDNNEGGGGLEIKVPGFKNNPAAPDDGQIFIEFYEGKLRVVVWKGKEEPEIIEVEVE